MKEVFSNHGKPLVEMAMSFMHSRVICAAARLELADELGLGPRSAVQLADKCSADPDALYRLLRALAALGIVREDEPGTFTLTDAGEPLQKTAANSVWPDVIFWAGLMADGWSRLTESVRTGQTAAEVMRHEGMASLWSRDPGAMEIFRSVMGAGPVEDYDAIVDDCELGDSKVCADLGGGAGALMMSILDRYPRIHGLLVERPGTIKNAEQRLTAAAYASRSTLVSGDLSHEVPSGADVYLLKHVLHGYRDEEAEEILRRCHQAMRVTARLMVIEFVMPEVISSADPRIAQRAMSDLTMLAITRGRERTLAEWSGLLSRSGFVLNAVRNVADGSLSVIEAQPVVQQKDPPHAS